MSHKLKSIPSEDFWQLISKPSLTDFYQAPTDIRKVAVAIWAIDAQISHIFWESDPEQMINKEKLILNKFAEKIPAFEIIREASNCLKHAVRRGTEPKTIGSSAVNIRPKGFGEAEFGCDEFGGTPIALVDYINGNSASIKTAVLSLDEWITEYFQKQSTQ
jgi:hypothetical protein